MLEISRLKESIGVYFYQDFDSVRRICSEIIRLSRQQNLLAEQLEAIYTLCWCANEHKRMQEYRTYMMLGNQLLKDHDAELRRIDAENVHRASMMHATGIYYFNLGDYNDAIASFSGIITLDGSSLTRDSSVLCSTCNYLGQSYQNLGSLDKSFQFFAMADNFLPKWDENYNIQHALFYLYQAEYQFSMGLIQDAFASLKISLKLFDKEPDTYIVRSYLKSNLLWIASFFQRIEAYDSAISYVNKAITLHVRNDPNFPLTYRVLGDIYYKYGKLDSALLYYTRSLSHANQIFKDRHFTKSEALIGIGNVYRDKKLFDKAAGKYKEGLDNLMFHEAISNIYNITSDSLSAMILPAEGMDVLFEQARLFYSWYKYNGNPAYLDSCITMLGMALQLNDLSRRELTNVRTRESKALLQKEITDLGVEVSNKAYELTSKKDYLMRAFAFMEKGKGNILLDQVNEVSAKKFSGIPEDILAEESRLKGELSVNEGRLLGINSSDSGYADIQFDYNDKLRKYINLISELEQKYPRYFKLKYDTKTAQVEEIQNRLASNHSLLIQYFVGNDKIYMAGITKRNVVLQVTERNDEFDRNLYSLLDQLGKSNIIEVENDVFLFNEFKRTARFLYTKILSPVLQKIKSPVKELIIIPDDYLSYLPFEILLTEEPEIQEADYSILPYLIREYQVRYDYSASLIIENVDIKQKNWKSYIGYAPTYENSIGHGIAIGDKLSPGLLYANKDEVEACRAIWKGTSMLGSLATEKSFREFVSQVVILHLAIHTILDDVDPQKSCFAFTSDYPGSEDGLLYTYELYNMNILAKLVILSGCETGIGNIKKGEGIISLARAFKFAGCPNIIMSLWKVNDQTTKKIMISFNQNLKKGMEKDKALQQAKISYLKGSKNLHPVFWSSFVLIGNDDPIRHTGKVLFVVLITCFLIPIALILVKKSHTSRR